MKTKIVLVGLMGMLCMGSCGDKNNVVEEPEVPVQIEPGPEDQPATTHSYTPVQLNETQKAINVKLQEFSWKLFKEVYANRNPGTNLMISPISLEVDLGMFINGLEGETLQEVLKTMGLENYTKEQINDFFKTMMAGIEKADEAAIFKSANAFWYNQNKKANADYLSVIKEMYAAKAEAANFSDPETVKIINQWCAEQTKNRIKEIIDKTSEADIFHLMNAVYFKASWLKQFNKDLTTKQPFYYANGKTEEVDMMYENATSIYSESPNLQMTIKAFVDGSFTLALILPKEGAKMEDAIEDVKNFFLSLKSPTETNVTSKAASINLYVPKFTAEYTEGNLFNYLKNINPTLQMSWQDLCMFENKIEMDFLAKQKTFFKMDEVGAEAAAVTVISGVTSAGPGPDPIVLRLDRPFFYAIVESTTECPLFIGYYGN
jgi:serpin B